MNIKYVVAIVRSDALDALESRLQAIRVDGLTVSRVKGYGEYKNLFTNDWMTEHTKVEIFAEESKVQAITGALLEISRSDVPGAGIVAVLSTERFVHLRTGAESLPDAF